MRTIQFTEAQATIVVRLLTEKWAHAACYGALDETVSRIWNDPCPGIGRTTDQYKKGRKKWFAEKRADAAMFSKMLWQFGIETPTVDTSSYFKPAVERSAYWKPTDMEFFHHRMMEYRHALIARVCGEPEPKPKPGDIPAKDREVASAVLKALNQGMRNILKS